MKKLQRALACLLACATALAYAPAPALASAQVTKNEIVYATYDADGGNAAYSVVNRFELGSAQLLTDYGVYQQVTNLTSTAPLHVSGDEITVQAVRASSITRARYPVRSCPGSSASSTA